MAANEPLTNEMEAVAGITAPPQPLFRLLGLATIKPGGRESEKARPVSGRAAVLVIV